MRARPKLEGKKGMRVCRTRWPVLSIFTRPRVLVVALTCLTAGSAQPKCELNAIALPVTMVGHATILSVRINGVDAKLALDSGAFFNEISSSAVAKFSLEHRPAPDGFFQRGLGGSEDTSLLRAKRFEVEGGVISNVEFLTTQTKFGSDVVGLLGQNFLHTSDVEYDLANGLVRIVDPNDDCKT
jgi:hypothetical protein